MPGKRYSPLVEALGLATAPAVRKPCDGCTMCCKLVPVAELGLPPFTRCEHERSFPFAGKPGCAIYATRPASCRVWSCQYLIEGWDDDLRPDRCGVVVDPQPDLVRLRNADTGKSHEVAAVQMWAAPGFEEAWQEQPVLALVLAALDRVGHVLWRFRNAEGESVAMHMGRDAAGNLFRTAPASHHAGFTAEMSNAERTLRAEAMLAERGDG